MVEIQKVDIFNVNQVLVLVNKVPIRDTTFYYKKSIHRFQVCGEAPVVSDITASKSLVRTIYSTTMM